MRKRRPERNEELTEDLLTLLGFDGFVRLVEAHGGIRIYVPQSSDATLLPQEIGIDNAARLCKEFGRSYIRVPLGREHRAHKYRQDGLTNGVIARRLGITETGVEKLFSRTGVEPKRVGRKRDDRQLDMFGPSVTTD
ncbi:hypothetical protein [Rhizobium metallidurans]|uniref:Mor transcription activator domain-containing protein n=1 Tax=Rhizobium metallidurans TaxID=1265931 RepID=A0A7W6GA27_9HYPH|nr:hypothetical protein [Rhizobium metallidurans]